MKQSYHYFRRENGIYYSLDTLTKKRGSPETTQIEEAQRLVNARNEACKQLAINLQITQVYLQHSKILRNAPGNTSWMKWGRLNPATPKNAGMLT